MKVASGTQPGQRVRLKGKGMPILRSKDFGDLYVQLDVETPQSLSKRQRELLEEFERESTRENSPTSEGLSAAKTISISGLRAIAFIAPETARFSGSAGASFGVPGLRLEMLIAPS